LFLRAVKESDDFSRSVSMRIRRVVSIEVGSRPGRIALKLKALSIGEVVCD
jgi:hypothetical protein